MSVPNLSRRMFVVALVALLVTGLGLTAFGQSSGVTEEEQTRWLGFYFFYGFFWAILFHKAGRAWWLAFIPIVNIFVFFDILGWHWLSILLIFAPFANIIFYFAVSIEVAHRFGLDRGWGFLMAFFWPIMIPILALGRAKYIPLEGRLPEPVRHAC